jgi:hypothetical protein
MVVEEEEEVIDHIIVVVETATEVHHSILVVVITAPHHHAIATTMIGHEVGHLTEEDTVEIVMTAQDVHRLVDEEAALIDTSLMKVAEGIVGVETRVVPEALSTVAVEAAAARLEVGITIMTTAEETLEDEVLTMHLVVMSIEKTADTAAIKPLKSCLSFVALVFVLEI